MKVLKLFFVIAMMAICTQVFAAGEQSSDDLTLGVTTVTAHKVEKDKQKLPASVTAYDDSTLETLAKENIHEIITLTPNINFTKMDSHTLQHTYRGIGGTANMNKVFYINLDGVAVPYVATDTMLEVERVELLRGGQGALYGRNTHTGLINVITRDPEFTDTNANLRFSYEGYNSLRLQAGLGGTFSDNLAYRFAFGYHRTDGYYENTYYDKDDTNDSEQLTGRAKFTYRTDDAGDFTLGIYADKFDAAFDSLSPAGEKVTHKTQNDETGENTGDIFSPTLRWQHTTDGGYSLTSITNYSRSTYGFIHDWDFTSMDMAVGHYDETFNVISQEFRISSEKSEKLQWLFGVFGSYEDLDTESASHNGTATGPYAGTYDKQESNIKTQNFAVFGQAVYRVFPKLELTGALRMDYERKKLDWENESTTGTPMIDHQDDENWVAFSPSVSAAWIISDTNRLYATVSRGFKAGDYNNVMPVPLVATSDPVDPEYTMTYEVGTKNSFFNNRMEINAALFYIDWTDMQVDLQIPGSGFFEKLNAAEAHSSGFELEARFLPAHGWTVFAGAGFMFEYEFDKFNNGSTDLKGKKLPYTNDYTLSLGTTYHSPSGFFVGADTSYRGEYYLIEDNSGKQDAYTMVNANVGYAADKWEVSVFGRNLLDETYATSSFSGALMAAEPLTFGVTAKLRF